MKPRYYDLNAGSEWIDLKNPPKYSGWDVVCVVREFDPGLKGFIKEAEKHRSSSDIELLFGARLYPKNADDVQKKARSALECGADIVLVAGGDEEINRAASECWEVDVLCHPERVLGKDLMDQKFSGVDDVMARYMAERMIAIEISLSELLSCYGMVRSQVMGRMRQNIMLAKKYGAPLILTSGAAHLLDMRSPQDLFSLGVSLGMDAGYARKALSEYPAMLARKSRDRRSPNVLLSGLEVISWGGSNQAREKKLFGWY